MIDGAAAWPRRRAVPTRPSLRPPLHLALPLPLPLPLPLSRVPPRPTAARAAPRAATSPAWLAALLAGMLALALLLGAGHVHRDSIGQHHCAVCGVLADELPAAPGAAVALPRMLVLVWLARAAAPCRCWARSALRLPPGRGPPPAGCATRTTISPNFRRTNTSTTGGRQQQ